MSNTSSKKPILQATQGFLDAIRAAGLQPPDEIIGDGKLYRFASESGSKKQNGRYLFHADHPINGWFMCHKLLQEGQQWFANSGESSQLTPAEIAVLKLRQEQAKAAREKDRAEQEKESAKKAAFIWSKSKPATEHPYLAAKGIQAHGIRATTPSKKYPDHSLVVPVRVFDGNNKAPSLSSLQFIHDDGSKNFLGGGAIAGGFFHIGKLTDSKVVICEGFATGASLHEATGLSVIVAFNAGNLKAVAEAMRKRYPEAQIILAADDDWRTEGNPGRTKAQEAAESVGGLVALPDFGGLVRGEKDTDFNDLHKLVGLEKVRGCIEQAEPQKKKVQPSDSSGKTKKPDYAAVGELLSKERSWLFYQGQLFVYENGVYSPNGEHVARTRTQEIYGKNASRCAGNEILYWLSIKHRKPADQVDIGDLINVNNGLLNPMTGELKQHSASHLSTIRIPVVWNPDAHHQRLDQFLGEVLPDQDTRQVLEEALGYLLVSDCRYEKTVMLTGEGANGKSVLLSAIEAMLGKQNISNLPLQAVQERFNTAQLVGKLANIFPDLPKAALQDTGIFKALVSGDSIQAERKHQDAFEFNNRAKLWFSANELPKIRDVTAAFWRRWIVVPFPNTFKEGDPRRDPTLKAKLQTPESLSYLLKLAVEGMQRLVSRGHFVESHATKAALENYRQESDLIAVYAQEHLAERDGLWVGKDDLYRHYSEWCESGGMHAKSKPSFGKDLHRLFLGLCESKRQINGKRTWAWINIGLVDEHFIAPPEKHDSAKNTGAPYSSASVQVYGKVSGMCQNGVRVQTPMDRASVQVSGLLPTITDNKKLAEDLEDDREKEKKYKIIKDSNGTPTRTLGREAMDTGLEPGHLPGHNPDTPDTNPDTFSKAEMFEVEDVEEWSEFE